MKKNKKGGVYFALFLTLIVAMVFFLGCAANGGNGNDPARNGDGEEKDISIETQAKKTYLDSFLKKEHLEATIEDVSFWPFLGIYNGVLVAVFYGGKYHGWFLEYMEEIEINGLLFEWSCGYPILVWKDRSIFELAEAVKKGILSKKNLTVVRELYYSKIKGE